MENEDNDDYSVDRSYNHCETPNCSAETGQSTPEQQKVKKDWTCRGTRNGRKRINMMYIVKEICQSKLACLQWMQSMGFLQKFLFCPSCGKKMKFEANEECADGYFWVCREQECRENPPFYSARHGTWLQSRDENLLFIISTAYFWSNNFTSKQIMNEVNITEEVYTEWDALFSSVCETALKREENHAYFKRKNNKEGSPSSIKHVELWHQKYKSKDPFIQLLKDAGMI